MPAPARGLDDEGGNLERAFPGDPVFLEVVNEQRHALLALSAVASRRRRSGKRSSGRTSQYCRSFSSVNMTPACPALTSLATA